MNILQIREKITPRGDGNALQLHYLSISDLVYKREDNSERRRKHGLSDLVSNQPPIIREKITPRGDGNRLVPFALCYYNTAYKREDNSERRRKPCIDIATDITVITVYKREDNSERRRKLNLECDVKELSV